MHNTLMVGLPPTTDLPDEDAAIFDSTTKALAECCSMIANANRIMEDVQKDKDLKFNLLLLSQSLELIHTAIPLKRLNLDFQDYEFLKEVFEYVAKMSLLGMMIKFLSILLHKMRENESYDIKRTNSMQTLVIKAHEEGLKQAHNYHSGLIEHWDWIPTLTQDLANSTFHYVHMQAAARKPVLHCEVKLFCF